MGPKLLLRGLLGLLETLCEFWSSLREFRLLERKLGNAKGDLEEDGFETPPSKAVSSSSLLKPSATEAEE